MKTTDRGIKGVLLSLILVVLLSINSSTFVKGNTIASKKVLTEVKSAPLSGALQDWMANGSYWIEETPINVKTEETEVRTENAVETHLSSEFDQFMSTGAYWEESKETEMALDADLTSWMRSGAYWSNDTQEN